VVLEKSLFSSPTACRKTIDQRLKKIEGATTPEAERDRDTLQRLADAVDAITPDQFTKYQRLLALLRKGGDLDWHPEQSNDRLVIFTERVETLKFLREHLEVDLKLKPAQIATLHGQESGDQALQDTVEKFGRDKESVRLLIATDIASEGINLHFLAHKLIHFDIVAVSALRHHQAQQAEEQQWAGSRWGNEWGLAFTGRLGKPLDERGVLRTFQKLLALAGLPKMRIHDLRHSAVAILIAQGVNIKAISELLGHSSVAFTL
jgi:hypothetical protein